MEFLKDRYRTIRGLKQAWNINPQEVRGAWADTGDHSVLHPMDLRKRGVLPAIAQGDYREWREQLPQDERHDRVLKDEYILSVEPT